jgi:hypothetical protein
VRVAGGAAPPAKQPAKGRAAGAQLGLKLDEDWVASHAEQVQRMLPGGAHPARRAVPAEAAAQEGRRPPIRPPAARPAPLAGLQVMGVYLFAPESGYQSISNQLSSLLNNILPAAAARGAAPASAADALLLHVDPDTRRTTLRSCAAGAASPGSLKPCELKYGSALPSLVCLTCR